MADYVRKINGTLLAASEVVPNSPLASKLASLVSGAFEVVSLNQSGKPDVANPSTKIIYLTKSSTEGLTDPYTEWIYTGTDGETADPSKWEIIGETSLNLSRYKTKQSAYTATGLSKSKTITSLTQNANGEISVTANDIPSATTSGAGLVQLAGSIGASGMSENNKAASEKAVRDAIDALDSEATSTGTNNFKFKVVLKDGKVTAVTVTNDDTQSKSNKVTTWSDTPSDAKYPSEKLVVTDLKAKADKVTSATQGNFAGLDSFGNLTDSGSKASDFATSAQGTKADSAIQGVKLNGASAALTPDSGKVVTIPNAIATGTTGATNGLMTADDKQKLNGIATGAEVNQNAFSNVKVGSKTVAADAKTDTLELATTSGKHITLTADATNDKITIDTDLEHKSASSEGTAVSLVTTGEMYNWNAKYSKPSGGIPKSDLASAVQSSLGLADSSVQGVTMDGSSIVDSSTKTAAIPKATTPTGTSAGVTGALGVVTLEIVSI